MTAAPALGCAPQSPLALTPEHCAAFGGGQRTRSGLICASLGFCFRAGPSASLGPATCTGALGRQRAGSPDRRDCYSPLALRTQPEFSLPSLPTSTFMMPFQLSPVETWKSVRKAMPKFSKVACRLMPSHGFSSLQTERKGGQLARCRAHPASSRNAQPTGGETEAQGRGTEAGAQAQVSLAPPPTQVSVPKGEEEVGEGWLPRSPACRS